MLNKIQPLSLPQMKTCPNSWCDSPDEGFETETSTQNYPWQGITDWAKQICQRLQYSWSPMSGETHAMIMRKDSPEIRLRRIWKGWNPLIIIFRADYYPLVYFWQNVGNNVKSHIKNIEQTNNKCLREAKAKFHMVCKNDILIDSQAKPSIYWATILKNTNVRGTFSAV